MTSDQELADRLRAKMSSLVSEANQGITHEQFVAGLENGELGLRFVCEPCTLLRGARSTIFTIVALLYTVGPLVLIPLWAFLEKNWWLLLGIAFSYAANLVAGSNSAQASYTLLRTGRLAQ